MLGETMRSDLRKLVLAGAVATSAAVLATPSAAHAFCGFYVAGSDAKMFNDATQVVLMRQGTRTVLSMQNHYEGPLEAFAMVIPVPTVLKEGDVKTLSNEVFAKVETMSAPRLVEYWEQDPCYVQPPYRNMSTGAMPADMATVQESGGAGPNLGVKIEAKFSVGEYNILILSAKDSTGLETWLQQEKYTIPAGAAALLKPYVASGMKFFVAKVDPTKVKFDGNKAMLSPLRFFYDSEEFALPIRLGLANSQGTQDLIVNILAPNKRYQVANYNNVTIPTNIDVKPSVRDRFGEFYAALFDATVAKNPGSVVTEYAWQAMGCDPCPGPMLDGNDLATLGGDVIGGAGQTDDSFGAPMGNMVLTRLHARYGKDIKDDLVFKEAGAIVGGREFLRDGKKLEEGSRPDSNNNFQGRYAIRHPWEGAITCKAPIRGRWGGPWASIQSQIADGGAPKAATNLAFAPRGAMALPTVVNQDVPEIALKADSTGAAVTASGSGSAATATPTPANATGAATSAAKKKGCGCQSSSAPADTSAALFLLGLALLRRRKR
jgi:MYXO-CTERM domain-containing protein